MRGEITRKKRKWEHYKRKTGRKEPVTLLSLKRGNYKSESFLKTSSLNKGCKGKKRENKNSVFSFYHFIIFSIHDKHNCLYRML